MRGFNFARNFKVSFQIHSNWTFQKTSFNTRNKGREYEKFEDFCSLFNLSNLIKSETCFSKNHKSTIDLFTTNKPNCFQNTHVTETGLSDFYKMISTLFEPKITRLKPRKIYYRNYKNFVRSSFLLDLKSTNLYSSSIDPDEKLYFSNESIFEGCESARSSEKNNLRGNHAPFVDKQLGKEIYKRSKLRNKHCKNPFEQNAALYKKQ